MNRYRFPNPISSRRHHSFFPSHSWLQCPHQLDSVSRALSQGHPPGLHRPSKVSVACVHAGFLWQTYKAVGRSQTSTGRQLLHLNGYKCQLKTRSFLHVSAPTRIVLAHCLGGTGLEPPSIWRHSTKVRLKQNQSRKLGVLLVSTEL